MSVLEALNNAYERLADRGGMPPFGYSNEKVGFLIALAEEGTPVGPRLIYARQMERNELCR
jgi:CRISPR-associated protein Csd1